jgi:hypothetical protein
MPIKLVNLGIAVRDLEPTIAFSLTRICDRTSARPAP